MDKTFDVLIEIPQGTKNNKYERDPKTDKIVLDFVFENLVWPFNYGEITNTLGGDGDKLDAIVFSSAPLEQGSTVKCIPFGVALMLDRGEVDDKVLLVPVDDGLQSRYKDISDFSESQRQSLVDLYMEIARQKKKIIEVKGFKDKLYTMELIRMSLT